jgi:hypothetical protein
MAINRSHPTVLLQYRKFNRRSNRCTFLKYPTLSISTSPSFLSLLIWSYDPVGSAKCDYETTIKMNKLIDSIDIDLDFM